ESGPLTDREINELQRFLLAEDSLILDWLLERQLGARKYADSHRTILRRGESSGAGAKVVCDEFFAHFGWACLHRVQTVVAHKGTPHVGAPRSAILTETTPRRINRAATNLLQATGYFRPIPPRRPTSRPSRQ